MPKVVIYYIVLLFAFSLPILAEQGPTNGTLLFREDFGGNNPSDPRIGTTPIASCSYTFQTTTKAGPQASYWLVKHGNFNGNQWHDQIDHTYPNDSTRGYYMLIDAGRENKSFYQLDIDGLCASSTLRFSAYVTNLHSYWHCTTWKTYAPTQLLFVVTDADTGTELGRYDTGEIPYDTLISQQYEGQAYKYSAEWFYQGFEITMPAGVDHVLLDIRNNCVNYNHYQGGGNDFAMDDIEVHLVTPEKIEVNDIDSVCPNDEVTLSAEIINNSTFSEPFDYQWEYSTDSINWTAIASTETYAMTVLTSSAGYYRLVIAPEDGISNPKCRAYSEGKKLTLKTQCTDTPEKPDTPDTPDKPEEPVVPEKTEIENLLINKYNWILVCNNTLLHKRYPDAQVEQYLWYKNDALIPSATGDDYTENQEFTAGDQYQLEVIIQGQSIFSNVVRIPVKEAVSDITTYQWGDLYIRREVVNDQVIITKQLIIH